MESKLLLKIEESKKLPFWSVIEDIDRRKNIENLSGQLEKIKAKMNATMQQKVHCIINNSESIDQISKVQP